MDKQTDVFVIGTGPSGMTAARTAKLRRPDLRVTAIRREPSYVPCALPYALGGVIEVDSYVKDEVKLMSGVGIELLEGDVAKIVPARMEVLLTDGTAYAYKKLIVASGAAPIIPAIPNVGARNVFSIRTPADVHDILDYGEGTGQAVVVGAGYIGVEVTCMMREAGREVALVERLDRVMPKTLDPEFSEMALERLRRNGVADHLGVGLSELRGEDDGVVTRVVLDNGASLECDVVILALGVKPRLRLFEEASIRTERDGVWVDERMRTSAENVYACGDCTRFRCLVTSEPCAGKLATNGVFQGKTAALNAIGVDRVFGGFVNSCVTDVFGLRIGAAGINEDNAARAGIEVVPGKGTSRTAYPMFRQSEEVQVKLLFDPERQCVIGGQVAGAEAVAERIDLIALAVQQRLTASDIAGFHYCAHPLQSGVPAHNPIVMAAEDAMRKL